MAKTDQNPVDINSIASVVDHSHKTIILTCQNMQDGVGDFEHLRSHAQDLAGLKQKGYKLVACLEIIRIRVEEGEEASDQTKLVNARAQYVVDTIKEEQQKEIPLFDDVFIAEEIIGNPYQESKDTFSEEERLRLKEVCQEAGSVFSCGWESAFFINLIKEFTGSRKSINHGQYGNGMGLRTENKKFPEGIKLYPERHFDDPAQRLWLIGQTDRSFLQHLTQQENPTVEDCEHYLQSQAMMPAYTQTFLGSAAFILSQALKMNKLNNRKPMDLILPGGTVDRATFKSLIGPKLQSIGIEFEDIEFISKDDLKKPFQASNGKNPKIRIISPFITKTEDYKALYSIATEGTGCSGDNSISDSFSSRALPFFQYKASVIGRFYSTELLSTVQHEASLCQDQGTRNALSSLHLYFEVMTRLLHDRTYYEKYSKEFDDIIVPQLFNPYTWNEPDVILNNIPMGVDPEQGKQDLIARDVLPLAERFADWCQILADLAAKPETVKGWEYFREQLLKKYNVREHFTALIVQNRVERARDQASSRGEPFVEEPFKKEILATEPAQALVNAKVIRNDGTDVDLDTLILLTSNPRVVEALVDKRITPDFVQGMNFKQILNLSDQDLPAPQPKAEKSRGKAVTTMRQAQADKEKENVLPKEEEKPQVTGKPKL